MSRRLGFWLVCVVALCASGSVRAVEILGVTGFYEPVSGGSSSAKAVKVRDFADRIDRQDFMRKADSVFLRKTDVIVFPMLERGRENYRPRIKPVYRQKLQFFWVAGIRGNDHSPPMLNFGSGNRAEVGKRHRNLHPSGQMTLHGLHRMRRRWLGMRGLQSNRRGGCSQNRHTRCLSVVALGKLAAGKK